MNPRNIAICGNLCYNALMNITRYLDIEAESQPGEVLLILGPRRSGKTTLIQHFVENTERSVAFYRGDELRVQHDFSVHDSAALEPLIGTHDTLVIDEAQMIPGIGKSLKLLVDTKPQLSIIVTGSSAFELSGQLGEPLTGRKRTKYLLPVSLHELTSGSATRQLDAAAQLPELLVYGQYPRITTEKDSARRAELLGELVDSYLLKDILAFQEVKGSAIILRLLNLLAYQIGSKVSLSEVGSSLGIDRKTVERYLDLLEKTFVIFRLGGYSRNLPSEVTKMAKYYFYDNGIRNVVIQNLNPIDIRGDMGQLWENFVISERQKRRLYHGPSANQYFWRTWQGSEIDLVEEREGKLFGYEMKWSTTKQAKAPRTWLDAYPEQASWQLITPDTAYEFLTW